ncbi:Phr family secreted Rap phosphatase inhibitor [Bacillus cereus]|nr:Phr family secreted Rap phosphatase inhibitor [Bacillus pseudomycoides]PEY29949.1 Phr family secreted Rap phosphatase inhibitor [Bacillus cereus]
MSKIKLMVLGLVSVAVLSIGLNGSISKQTPVDKNIPIQYSEHGGGI